jgi:cyclopropane-fatty-acyl-phospholipid synthase
MNATGISAATRQPAGLIDRLARAALLRRLAQLQEGHLTLIDDVGRHEFGHRQHELSATIIIDSPAVYRRLAFGGTVGAGAAYVDGLWRCDDLPALIRIFVRNEQAMLDSEKGLARLTTPLYSLGHALRRNTQRGSRRNVAEHYDLGNEFFELMLDPSMTYSSGIFESDASTLEEASIAKIDRLCRKLDLRPGDQLVEIGTGWGSFAIHAAGQYGCRVTTTTISAAQHAEAARRIAAAGLSDRIRLLRCDYRELSGRYDKLVSVEMIEAVGHHYYDVFLRKCSDLLRPDGLMGLQAITIADRRYDEARRRVDFIKKFIFPGTCIPSLAALTGSLARATDLRLFHLEDITPHYARTLRLWRENLTRNFDQARALGFTDRFLRMWEYYLCYCEGGFAEHYIGDVQMIMTKPRCARGPILPALGSPGAHDRPAERPSPLRTGIRRVAGGNGSPGAARA